MNTSGDGWYYLAVDGDQIGRRLELAMLNDDLAAAVALSESVLEALRSISLELEALGFEILFQGGDNLLARYAGTPQHPSGMTYGDLQFTAGGSYSLRGALTALLEAKLERSRVGTING